MIARLVATLLLRLRALFWRAVYAGFRSKYAIHPSFRFNGAGIQLYGEGEIRAGEESYVGELSTVQAARGQNVTIGRKCRISHNVRIYTTTALPDSDFTAAVVPTRDASVFIGDGVWIGANVLINPGVVIEANAVIGANSVVSRPVGPGEVWGGVPARFIRRKASAGKGIDPRESE